MSELKDFMGKNLEHGKLYTYTYSYQSGSQSQYLLMFDKHVKKIAIFKQLSSCLTDNPLCIKYHKTTCYLLNRILIRITPDMLPDNINNAITDWFYEYTLENNLTDFTNEWWPKKNKED